MVTRELLTSLIVDAFEGVATACVWVVRMVRAVRMVRVVRVVWV